MELFWKLHNLGSVPDVACDTVWAMRNHSARPDRDCAADCTTIDVEAHDSLNSMSLSLSTQY